MRQDSGARAEGIDMADAGTMPYSMGSPLLHLPGSMPPASSVTAPQSATGGAANGDDAHSNAGHGDVYLPRAPDGLPASTAMSSGLSSFFRTFNLSGSAQPSHANTVSPGIDSNMLGGCSSTATGSASSPSSTYQSQSGSIHAMQHSPPSSSSTSTMSAPGGPAGASAPTTPPFISGGQQIKRAFSNSSAAKRMRKLSNPIPSFLASTAGPSSGAGRDSPISISSPLAGSPGGNGRDGNSLRNVTPRQLSLQEREDELHTPMQNQQQTIFGNLPSTGSGIISSSLGFLTSIAALDKLPSVLGLSGLTLKDTYPRGEDDNRTDLTEDMDLRIEDATGDEDFYSDASLGMQRAKANGLEDAATISTNSYVSTPPEAIARAGTSTTLGSSGGTSSHLALSPVASNLTYSSTSSSSLHAQGNENGPTTAIPLASRSMVNSENHSSILDPVTYQTLRRKNSEADARRVERERQDRARQLDLLDRLQEQAQHPLPKYADTLNHAEAHNVAELRPSLPLVPQRESKLATIGLGIPPRQAAPSSGTIDHPPAATPDGKKSRRRSLFGRLGFSAGSKGNRSSPSKTSTPASPQVRLSHSNSVSSIGSTQAAPSFVKSFQVVAEATPSTNDVAVPPPSTSSPGIDIIGSPQSDVSISIFPTAIPIPIPIKGSSKKSRYIKTKLKNKTKREFNHLFLAQELEFNASPDLVRGQSDLTHPSPLPDLPETPASTGSPSHVTSSKTSIGRKASRAGQSKSSKKIAKDPPSSTWTLKFSVDGNYLASAGQDGIIRIWQVISGSEERERVITAMHTDLDDSPTDAGGSGFVMPTAGSAVDHFSGQPASKKDKRNSKMSILSTATTPGAAACSSAGAGTPMGPEATPASARSCAPVFISKPIYEWKGHTSDILDLSWSKNNFLISSSMDKTVRLWHISRKECLCVFQHPDFVTSIAFHPKDDRYFLSGSLDAKLRLWSIPDKKVHCWTQLPELITSVAFTNEGKLACAGTFVGICLFFDVRDLAFVAKLHSRSSRGKYAKGRKITSVVALPKGEPSEPDRVLITSNDSRLRLWDISSIGGPPREKGDNKPVAPRLISERHVEAKYKGHENTSSQIKATFSDDGRYVISGSEDRQCYIWQSGLLNFPVPFAKTSKKGADKSPGSESFNPSLGSDSHCGNGVSPGIVTCAIFAPMETRLTLARGGDPLYGCEDDLHVTARGDLQRSPSQGSSSSSMNPNETPSTPFGSLSNKSDDSTTAIASNSNARGAIIITADDNSGTIRVFRNNAVFSQSGLVPGRDVKSVSSSIKDKCHVSGNGTQRKTSQISKQPHHNGRIRGSLERQRRGFDDKHDMEELTV